MKTFLEEKEYFRTTGSPIGSPWGYIASNPSSIDSDIQSFIQTINSTPFTYSPGMCCSGSKKDHRSEFVPHNMRFGTALDQTQGYAVIRANISDNRWNDVSRLLQRVNHSQLVPSQDWERDDCRCTDLFPITTDRDLFAYQIFTGVGKNTSEYMSFIWNDLASKIDTLW